MLRRSLSAIEAHRLHSERFFLDYVYAIAYSIFFK